MNKTHRILLALLSALLLSIAFYSWGTGLLLFIAFVPLLWIEDFYTQRRRSAGVVKSKDSLKYKESRKGSMTWYAVLSFGIWVMATTYWVYWATWVGIVASVLVNTTYMTLTFWLFHRIRLRLGDRIGYASLVIFWLAFEFLYLRAQYNFPWLILGNGFANDVSLIQWYEWTGALGGSLWVLILNILIFKVIKAWRKDPVFAVHRRRLSVVVLVLVLPMFSSLLRYLTYEEDDAPYEIVVLQPNIDPYIKFTGMSAEEQTGYLLHIADSLITPETEYLVGPETFLNNSVWESQIQYQAQVRKLKAFMRKHPGAKMVMGATTLKQYRDPSQYTSTSRPMGKSGKRYDSFNSAFQLDSTDHIPIYHKSLLVAGVETMPHAQLLGFLEKLTVKLGGSLRSHGTQEYRDAFPSPSDSTRVAPVICWESVFGEYVTGYVRDADANFLFIITNDGWWKNTPGHRQHNSFARLRAIETRRSVARSANTGISSLIDQRGVELARVGWWERSGLRGELNKNDHITFYVKHGDYLGRIAVFLTVILLLYSISSRTFRKKSS